MGMENYTPHQQKIIKRYYSHQDDIQLQKLGEMVTDLYLATGKKKDKLWMNIGLAMQKLGVPQSRIDHIMTQNDPKLVANLVTELQKKS